MQDADMEPPTYEERVAALEHELGVCTSDAQAMIDAEDLLAYRAGRENTSWS